MDSSATDARLEAKEASDGGLEAATEAEASTDAPSEASDAADAADAAGEADSVAVDADVAVDAPIETSVDDSGDGAITTDAAEGGG